MLPNMASLVVVVKLFISKIYGSCLLWVMSTEIAVDIAVDTRSIVVRHSVDSRWILGQHSVDSQSIYHRHMTDSKARCVVEISTDTRPIVYLTIDRPLTDCRPTIDRLSTDCRPLYRPLCRPISQSTLPTVNKIQIYCPSMH